LGEFEYLYHKNNSQQVTPQSIDQYLEMFINYKLKVAEAEAAGIDTTATFLNELKGYARDLAQPYLTDQDTEQRLIDNIYNRLKEEVNVSHIMMFTGNTPSERQINRARLDSIRAVIMAGGDFEALAGEYSIDRASRDRGGNMGYITACRFPYTFEDAAYDTPMGQLSEVIETPFGFHLVKPVDRRQARGEILVQHILKLTQGLTPDQISAKRHQIDSIHSLLAAGADFDDLAARESEDPGSARQGGRLPWFSTGRMVKPFEEASFALADGQTSDIVETDFGFHIIRRLDTKGIGSKEAMTPMIKNVLAQDERGSMPRKAALDRYKQKFNLTMNRPALAMVESVIKSNGCLASAVIAR
ncbi:MAG: peptidyl-prolyl cis-trans isomerase, partial [Muribaculaceae bacterium]|nr:peptidyl-prolyl cis-trans isomerase [Muribaculaceae bacterium]